MKNTLLYFSILCLFVQCKSHQKSLTDILNAEYDQHFISAGNNFPQISLLDNDRYKFLIGLHNQFSIEEIKEVLKWSDTLLIKEIKLLKENGYLKEKEEKLFPSISIIMQDEGKQLFEHTIGIADQITASIIKIEPEIKQMYSKMEVSETYPYSDFSFFLLSDVLLDNWQINNVEGDYLKKERTLRHGKRYYIQFAEKDALTSHEVFGIYGNQYSCNDSVCFITYGNNRVNNVKSLGELAKMNIPVLSKKDQNTLIEMAAVYTPELIELLKKNDPKFVNAYENSVFKNEIPFEEYFIWYYHFLYTRVTDILSEKEYLKIPENGIFRVKLEQ